MTGGGMAGVTAGVVQAMGRAWIQAVVLALALCACAAGPGAIGERPAELVGDGAVVSDGGPDGRGESSADAGGADAGAVEAVVRLPAGVEGRIDAVVRGAMARKEVPGAVVLVVLRGQVVLRKAYGARSVVPNRSPMTVDTVFDLASLTKPIVTATAVALLQERGALAVDAAVGRYLPSFAVGDKKSITVAQLMQHTSGLPPGTRPAKLSGDREHWLTTIAELPLRHRPGAKRLYSDLGYIVLGALVERLAGEPLDQFAAERFFGPLGMGRTAYRPGAEMAASAAPTTKREGQWLRGQVHDPSAAALGGVAGHAGLFSTGDDLARFARMLLAGGRFDGWQVLTSASVDRLTGRSGSAATPHALAWSIVAGGVAHTGFTGTYLWLDRRRGTALVALASRLHPDGKGDATRLRRELRAVVRAAAERAEQEASEPSSATVRLGVDRLVAAGFAALRGRRVGLLTNHTGRASDGRRTIDLLHEEPTVELKAVFSPEHGAAGTADGPVASGRDAATGVVVHSLYGASKRPSRAQLAGIDTLVFDLQDIGCRFYTYISTLGYLLEAAAKRGLKVVVLDRPNPIDGITVEGPLLDAGRESFVGYHPIPVRHGMTVGELAKLFNEERKLGVSLAVVPLQGWRREQRWDDTGLPWRNTSPNMRSPAAALLYPGIGLLEATHLSVGRGTNRPFEQIGAPWLDGDRLAAQLEATRLPGVRFSAVEFTPTSSVYAAQPCRGVAIEVIDPASFRAVRTGIAIAQALRTGYPKRWRAAKVDLLLRNRRALTGLLAGESLDGIVTSWQRELAAFRARRRSFLLY